MRYVSYGIGQNNSHGKNRDPTTCIRGWNNVGSNKWGTSIFALKLNVRPVR